MAQIIEFELSTDDFLELADKALKSRNIEKSIYYTKKALENDSHCAEASSKLASIYSGLGAQNISNTILFDALAKYPSDENENRIFYMLAMNFLESGDLDVATYYMREFADDYEITYPENEDPQQTNGGFRVVYPKGDDYYAMLIEKAYNLVREKQFDNAIKILEEVDPKSKSIDAANHVMLVCYMMKNDIDHVIDSAKDMLSKNDSLAVKCTLATAYMMEEKMSEAYQVLDEVLAVEHEKIEDILLLLPLLVNMEVHNEVVKYTKRVLDSLNLQPNTMVWLSQGLYNIGQKTEAKKVMRRVLNIYGDFSPADYYLKLYETNPEKIEYSMNIPYAEKILRVKRIDEFLSKNDKDFAMSFCHNDEFNDLIDWAINDGNEQLIYKIMDKLDKINNKDIMIDFYRFLIRDLYDKILIKPNLSFELMARTFKGLLNKGYNLDTNVVAQDRFKEITFTLPKTYYKFPNLIKQAISYCYCDIAYTDEMPHIYLGDLEDLWNSFATLDEKGQLLWKKAEYSKMLHFRSVKTLVGVVLSKVYEDDEDSKQDAIRRYNINPKTFDKYYNVLFGEEE